MHTTTTPSGRPRRVTPEDVRDAIVRRLAAQGVSADHLARVLSVSPAMPEPEPERRPRYAIALRGPEGAGLTTWRVLADGREEVARLCLDAGFARASSGRRVDHVMYVTLNLPRLPGQAEDPYAHAYVYPSRDGETLRIELACDLTDPVLYAPEEADGQDRARVLLADIWLSGELRRLYHTYMGR